MDEHRPRDGEPDYIAALVRTAGRRALPDAARFARARQNVSAEWYSVIASARRARQQRFAAVFVIVAIAAAFTAVFWPKPAQPVATASRVVGDVLVRQVHQGQVQAEPLKSLQILVSGTELDTGVGGRVFLDWANGAHLSLDKGALVELRSETELRLTRGAVYVETQSSGAHKTQPLVVTTPFGTARHVGTRFEVYVAAASARVRVREGTVRFSKESQSPVTINAGQQLSVVDGSLALEPGPGSADPAWDWVQDIAPRLVIEGRSAFDALESLGHVSGLQIIYADGSARSQARSVILRGSIEGLETRKALLAVLAGSGLEFDMHGDRVEIRASREP